MKVAITGISSKLGKALFPLLDSDPDITEVLGIDIVDPKIDSSKLRFIKEDVRDKCLLDEFQGYDVIIHLAFIVDQPLPGLKETFSINISGSANVFNCAIKAGIKKIIHTSSIAAYGAFKDNPAAIKEDFPLRLMNPLFYYNATKYYVEKYLDRLEKRFPDLIITRFRPCIIGFPGTLNLVSGKMVITPSPNVKMQFIHYTDLIQAFYLAIKKDAPGAFNLAGDNPLTWKEVSIKMHKGLLNLIYPLILVIIEYTYKLRLQRLLGPGWIRVSKYPIVLDTTKAKEELGWKPKFDTLGTIIQGLKDSQEL